MLGVRCADDFALRHAAAFQTLPRAQTTTSRRHRGRADSALMRWFRGFTAKIAVGPSTRGSLGFGVVERTSKAARDTKSTTLYGTRVR